MQRVGFQIYADLYDCKEDKISQVKHVRKIFLNAIKSSGFKIIKGNFHQFNPHGVTGSLMLMESHANIHTWPELRYVSLDIFTCDRGGKQKSRKAVEKLRKLFGAKRIFMKNFHRGIR